MGRDITTSNEDPDKLEGECVKVINFMRFMGGIDSETGAKIKFMDMSNQRYSRAFILTGYNLHSVTAADESALEAMMTIKVEITNYETNKRLICTAPLVGTTYSVDHSPLNTDCILKGSCN